VLIRSIDVVGALESSQVEGDQDLELRVGGGLIQACGSGNDARKKIAGDQRSASRLTCDLAGVPVQLRQLS
jgi:hypothetical protein